MPKITRRVVSVAYEEVELPENHKVCSYCDGKAYMSKYDEGWRSLVHSPELSALRACMFCGGRGFVEDFGAYDDE